MVVYITMAYRRPKSLRDSTRSYVILSYMKVDPIKRQDRVEAKDLKHEKNDIKDSDREVHVSDCCEI